MDQYLLGSRAVGFARSETVAGVASEPCLPLVTISQQCLAITTPVGSSLEKENCSNLRKVTLQQFQCQCSHPRNVLVMTGFSITYTKVQEVSSTLCLSILLPQVYIAEL